MLLKYVSVNRGQGAGDIHAGLAANHREAGDDALREHRKDTQHSCQPKLRKLRVTSPVFMCLHRVIGAIISSPSAR